MRIVALLAAYNEERFIAGCIEHLNHQGVSVYLIDNGSTDKTPEIAQRYLGRGLIGYELFPRLGVFDLRAILQRKEELALSLDADWFVHLDTDEIRLAPNPRQTLTEAIIEADSAGFNAVNFQEFTFIPTAESPDHDHPEFRKTMRWYYPFLPYFPHRLNAWKRQTARVDLSSKAGHQVSFSGLRMYPQPFFLKHYLFLSLRHAEYKYAARRHSPIALAAGWHGWREQFRSERIKLPSEQELRTYISDDLMDASDPRVQHYVS